MVARCHGSRGLRTVAALVRGTSERLGNTDSRPSRPTGHNRGDRPSRSIARVRPLDWRRAGLRPEARGYRRTHNSTPIDSRRLRASPLSAVRSRHVLGCRPTTDDSWRRPEFSLGRARVVRISCLVPITSPAKMPRTLEYRIRDDHTASPCTARCYGLCLTFSVNSVLDTGRYPSADLAGYGSLPDTSLLHADLSSAPHSRTLDQPGVAPCVRPCCCPPPTDPRASSRHRTSIAPAATIATVATGAMARPIEPAKLAVGRSFGTEPRSIRG